MGYLVIGLGHLGNQVSTLVLGLGIGLVHLGNLGGQVNKLVLGLGIGLVVVLHLV